MKCRLLKLPIRCSVRIHKYIYYIMLAHWSDTIWCVKPYNLFQWKCTIVVNHTHTQTHTHTHTIHTWNEFGVRVRLMLSGYIVDNTSRHIEWMAAVLSRYQKTGPIACHSHSISVYVVSRLLLFIYEQLDTLKGFDRTIDRSSVHSFSHSIGNAIGVDLCSRTC